jgi:hypothetical protein
LRCLLALGLIGCGVLVRAATAELPAPLLSILDRFVGTDIPTLGPVEPEPTPRGWPEPTSFPTLPGRGIEPHPMLYAGEGYNTIFLVNHCPRAGQWQLSGGVPQDEQSHRIR